MRFELVCRTRSKCHILNSISNLLSEINQLFLSKRIKEDEHTHEKNIFADYK